MLKLIPSLITRQYGVMSKLSFHCKEMKCQHVRSISTSVDLSGIIPPIPTSFKQDESIAYDMMQNNFKKWNTLPFKGYLVEGSNGEYTYLTTEERIELIKIARTFIPKDKIIFAGSGCESSRETIYLTNKMAESGADVAMIVTPCYYKSGMKDNALHHHYEEIANNSKIPILIYNVPAYTGIDISVNAIASLASHKNIIGMKESGGDITKIANVLHRTEKEDFQVLAGSAGFLLAALQIGCVGGVCALANVLGEEVCRLHQLFLEGDLEEARKLQKLLIMPNAAVTKLHGVPGLKTIMDAKGFYGGPCRSPLQSLSVQEATSAKEHFTKAGFL